MIERESFWSKVCNTSVKERISKTAASASLELKREKSETKKGKLCTSGKSIPERTFPVGEVETKNHPSKLYLNLKSILSANRDRLTE